MPRLMFPLEIYTDGSAIGPMNNGRFGGWAYAILRDNVYLYKESDSVFETTNQQMELTAAAKGLKKAAEFKRDIESVVLYSDSAYLVNCYLNGWWQKWQVNGWKNSSKQPVANQELWEQIIPFFENPQYSLSKVKAHSTNRYNNEVDRMATEESKALEVKWRGRLKAGDLQGWAR